MHERVADRGEDGGSAVVAISFWDVSGGKEASETIESIVSDVSFPPETSPKEMVVVIVVVATSRLHWYGHIYLSIV